MGLFGSLFGKGNKTTTEMPKGQEKGETKMAKDPVCGMQVDEKKAAAKSEHVGKTYYFCAPGCKKAFDQNPAKYVAAGSQPMAGHGGHKM